MKKRYNIEITFCGTMMDRRSVIFYFYEKFHSLIQAQDYAFMKAQQLDKPKEMGLDSISIMVREIQPPWFLRIFGL